MFLVLCICAFFCGCEQQPGNSSGKPTLPSDLNLNSTNRMFDPNWHKNTTPPSDTEVNFDAITNRNSGAPAVPSGGRGVVSDGNGGFVARPMPDNFQETGYWCGPTSVQTVLRFWGINMSQRDIANSPPGDPIYPGQNQGGARWGPMVTLAKSKGFSNSRIYHPDTINNLKERVRAGRPQIVSVNGSLRYPASLNTGKFQQDRTYTTGGHVMVVKGFTANGDVIVNDSAGRIGHAVMRKSDFERVWRGNGIDFAR
jgi:predicted double-glycine peptidase